MKNGTIYIKAKNLKVRFLALMDFSYIKLHVKIYFNNYNNFIIKCKASIMFLNKDIVICIG